MDTPIYIYPIWKTTYYALDEDVDTVMYRIVAEDGEVIFTGRARKRPDEEYIFINLNKPCQNHIDSIITPGLGVRRSNGYRAFTLQFKFDGNDAGWDTWHEFAFYNDWSYEERSNGDDAPASVNQSEPINGHAAPGMFIPSTYVITGASEEICYEEREPVPPVPPGYLGKYLTFEILSGGTIGLKGVGSQCTGCTVYYSADSGSTWDSISVSGSGTDTFAVEAGDTILLKREGGKMAAQFTSTSNFNVYGNIMSLQYGDSFYGEGKELKEEYDFRALFMGTNAVDASNLVLPSDTLTDWCYYKMFENCTSLTNAPALPATTLTDTCYSRMFFGCSSLTDAPALPATELATYCYDAMFSECTSLTKAPFLPATTLVVGCYSAMFYGCQNLSEITCLAMNFPSFSISDWVYGVSPTGTFIKAPAATWPTGENGIPSGWTVIDYSN